MIPRQPHQTPDIWAQARRGVELVARDEHALLPAFEVYADYLVYGFVSRVLLPYGDEAATVPVDHHVGVSPTGLRRKRSRLAARDPAVDPLVREVREVDRASVDDEAAPTVLVHPRARVKRPGRNVLGPSVRRQEYDDVAPALSGAALQPVHVPTVGHHFRQPHYAPDDHIRGDRRPPGTVGRDPRFGHDSAPPRLGVSEGFFPKPRWSAFQPVSYLLAEMLLFGRLEDQPRALEAFAYRFASPAGYHAHQPVALTGEVLERLDHLIAVQNEDHPVLHRELLDGLSSRLLRAYGLGQQPLPLGGLGPQPASARIGLSLEGRFPLAPIFHMLLDPVQYPLYGGRAMLAHYQPPLFVCPSATHSTPVSPRASHSETWLQVCLRGGENPTGRVTDRLRPARASRYRASPVSEPSSPLATRTEPWA